MRKQAGFTIIELVVVIILLGIMAATALPRFMSVTDEAHGAVLDGVQGGLRSGFAMFRAQWIAEGQPDPDEVITAFGSLRPNDSGYPYGTVDNSAGTSTVTTNVDCVAVYNNILQADAPSIAVVADLASVVDLDGTDFLTHTTATSNCLYYYIAQSTANEAIVPTLVYNSTTGTVAQGTVTLPAGP